jgi:hypothetical protein
MKKVDFVPFLLTNNADIFSIRINEDKLSELEKFLIMFKDQDNVILQNDMNSILVAIEQIAENGALQSFFRNEGKMNDRVCAIPLYIQRRSSNTGTLRLYCIRISDKLLIVGGGGLKMTRTYQEDSSLSEIIRTLQTVDQELSQLESMGKDLTNDIYNLTVEID